MMNDSNYSKLSRRSFAKHLGVGVAAGLAGCGGNGNGEDSLSGDSGNGSTDSLSGDSGNGSSGAPIFWHNGLPADEEGSQTFTNSIQNEFQESTGEELEITEFEYEDARQSFLTGATSGDPDAIEGVLSHLTEYAQAGNIEPITDQVEDLDYFDGYVDSTIDAMRYEGEIYGLPYRGNGRGLIYRQDILEELGQEPPETADEFLEIGRLIKSEMDITPYHNCTEDGSVRGFQEWMSHVYQHVDNLYVRDNDSWQLNIDADTLGLIFDKFYYQVWASEDPIANPDQRGTGWQVNDPGYLNGEFAMIECGPWIKGATSGDNINDSDTAQNIADEKTAVGHLPHAETGDRGTFLEVNPVMVNTHSDQKDLSFEAVRSSTAPSVINEFSGVQPGDYMTPVHEDVESTVENERWEPFVDVFETGRALAKITWGSTRQEFYPLMQEVVYGQTDPYDAGETLHSNLKGLEDEL